MIQDSRGATVVNYILIIGVLIISIFVVISLQKTSRFHSKKLELDVAQQFLFDLKSIIETGESYPSDLKTVIEIPFIREYELKITKGRIEMHFPREDITLQEPLSSSNLNLIPTTISSSGKIYVYAKHRNFIVTDNISCNTEDEICDYGCFYYEKCDPECYSPYFEDVCNPYCIDIDNNGYTNGDDSDNICDPDCYNNKQNGGYYDIDCIKSGDGICDPDTHNVKDDICDTDCKKSDHICDPDCGISDLDCPFEVGDDECEVLKDENCLLSPDCTCDLDQSCKLSCTHLNLDDRGCINNTYLVNTGGPCTSDCDCTQDHICVEGHCCPTGMIWEDDMCSYDLPDTTQQNTWKLVVVPINFNFPHDKSLYRDLSEEFFNNFVEISPFQDCPGRAELLMLEEDCSEAIMKCMGTNGNTVASCSGQCASQIIECAFDEYTDFDKAQAIFYGDLRGHIGAGKVVGCAPLSNLGQDAPYFRGSTYGGAIHEYPLANRNLHGNIHELGHDMGLCHSDCPDCRRPSTCPNNDACDGTSCTDSRYIMSYGTMETFAPESFEHIRNHIDMEQYFQGCGT